MKLILLRHGESQWNLENRFTGWKDVPLTPKGIIEAEFSGNQIKDEKISISSIHTSLLQRAIHSTEIVSEIIGFEKDNIVNDWRLNERHYGALQGLNKSETASKYGEHQVHIWRRSYDIPPPLLKEDDKRHPIFNEKFKKINEALPNGESLKCVIKRLKPFWNTYFEEIKKLKGNHLIVAHSNSLRAIIKLLDNLNDSEIMSVNIPTGVPLVYSFDDSFNILSKKYLMNKSLLKKKQDLVINQGKI